MSARLLVIGCALAACGDNHAAPDDASDGSPPALPCAAVFSENFTETWAGPVNCATVDTAGDDGHTTLRFAIPARTIDAQFAISIDLGEAPSAGTYTAQNLVTPWSADALHEFEMTSCLYHAGAATVPPSTFTLALDALDAIDAPDAPDAINAHAHGKLDVMLYVLSRPYTYCGETNIERLAVTF